MLRNALILFCSAAILVSAAENAGSPVVEVPQSQNSADSGKLTVTESTTPTPVTEETTIVPTTITTKTITTPSTTPTPTSTPRPTPAPIITTTSPPTIKSPPTPVSPETGKWSVNGTKEICIVVQMAVQFEIMYPFNNTNKTVSQKLNLPVKNIEVNGTCGPKEQTIILSWNSTLGYFNDSFTIHFVKNDTTKQYTLHHLELFIVPQELPNFNYTSNDTLKYVHVQDEFHTGLSNSYRCANPPKFNLTQNGMVKGTIQFSNVQFQAFRSDKTTNFGLAEDCLTDTPDVVPIAVGCALAALVVIVLVAYLIGRRRAQGRGYVSM